MKDEIDDVLSFAEEKIRACLKECEKQKKEKILSSDSLLYRKAHFEALGYKTSLECIKRARERFDVYPYGKDE